MGRGGRNHARRPCGLSLRRSPVPRGPARHADGGHPGIARGAGAEFCRTRVVHGREQGLEALHFLRLQAGRGAAAERVRGGASGARRRRQGDRDTGPSSRPRCILSMVPQGRSGRGRSALRRRQSPPDRVSPTIAGAGGSARACGPFDRRAHRARRGRCRNRSQPDRRGGGGLRVRAGGARLGCGRAAARGLGIRDAREPVAAHGDRIRHHRGVRCLAGVPRDASAAAPPRGRSGPARQGRTRTADRGAHARSGVRTQRTRGPLRPRALRLSLGGRRGAVRAHQRHLARLAGLSARRGDRQAEPSGHHDAVERHAFPRGVLSPVQTSGRAEGCRVRVRAQGRHDVPGVPERDRHLRRNRKLPLQPLDRVRHHRAQGHRDGDEGAQREARGGQQGARELQLLGLARPARAVARGGRLRPDAGGGLRRAAGRRGQAAARRRAQRSAWGN